MNAVLRLLQPQVIRVYALDGAGCRPEEQRDQAQRHGEGKWSAVDGKWQAVSVPRRSPAGGNATGQARPRIKVWRMRHVAESGRPGRQVGDVGCGARAVCGEDGTDEQRQSNANALAGAVNGESPTAPCPASHTAHGATDNVQRQARCPKWRAGREHMRHSKHSTVPLIVRTTCTEMALPLVSPLDNGRIMR